MPSPLLCCLGGHQGLKSMHPTKFLGCNPWTLPFPIPAGAQGPAGLQSARSRAGPAGQSSVFCPLDFQRTLGCLEEPRRLGDFSAEGWSGKGLDPKGEACLRPPGGGAPRMCQQRAEYVGPCSTQSQCPDPWSAPLRCAHWMPILGDPGAHEMGVPSRNGDPREHNWEALPHPRQEPNPAPRHPGSPRPCRTPSAFPAAVAISESTTGKPSPTPARSRHPPCAARGAPPLPRSRGDAHLHQRLSVSPVPTPGSRRGSRTSLLPPGQT